MAKTTTETTITEPRVDATNCPERTQHRERLNTVCPACGEVIPGGNMYTPDQMARFFPGGMMVQAPHDAESLRYAEANAELWRQYQIANQAFNDAAFRVDELRRKGSAARGYDTAAAARGMQLESQIEAAEDAREKLREASQRILLTIGEVDAARAGKNRAALWAESFPSAKPAPGIGERIAALIRGESA